MKKRKPKKKKMVAHYNSVDNWIKIGAIIILVLGIITLISVPGIALFKSLWNDNSSISVIRIEHVVPDSTVNLHDGCYLSRLEVDTLLDKLDYHEAVLENKYNTLIEQRHEEDRTREIFLYVFGIVISVLGYFGYKSFNDVEKRAEKEANRIANKIARKVAKEVSENKCEFYSTQKTEAYLKKNLKAQIDAKVEGLYSGKSKETLKRELEIFIMEKITELKGLYLNSRDNEHSSDKKTESEATDRIEETPDNTNGSETSDDSDMFGD